MTVEHGIVIAWDDDGELSAVCAACGRRLDVTNWIFLPGVRPDLRITLTPCRASHDAEPTDEYLRMREDPAYARDPTI